MKNESHNFAFIYRKDGHFTYCGDFKRNSPEQVKLGVKLFNVVGFPAPGDHLSLIETVDINNRREYVHHVVTATELQAILNKAKEEESEQHRKRRARTFSHPSPGTYR